MNLKLKENTEKTEQRWLEHGKIILALIFLYLVIHFVYVFLYPMEDQIRATLIGATAFFIICIPLWKDFIGMKPWLAFLPIYAAALLGALLIELQVMPSDSPISGIIQVIILIVTYILIVTILRLEKK